MAEIPDPEGNYYFSLEVNGTEIAHFLEFSGLKTSSAAYEVQEGGLNGRVHNLPGTSKYENLVLKFATSASLFLAEWRDKYLREQWEDRPKDSGAVVMRNNHGDEVRRYSFGAIWPVSWEGPSFASSGSAIAIETLEIAFDQYVTDFESPQPEPTPEPDPPSDEPLATEPIQFGYDSDDMTPEGEAACDRVASSINNQDPPPKDVWIDAHTCTQGSWSYNLRLSNDRAAATKAQMASRCKDTTFHSTGFSYAYPVASNGTEAGRSQNRRTEFFETPPDARGRVAVEPRPKPS